MKEANSPRPRLMADQHNLLQVLRRDATPPEPPLVPKNPAASSEICSSLIPPNSSAMIVAVSTARRIGLVRITSGLTLRSRRPLACLRHPELSFGRQRTIGVTCSGARFSYSMAYQINPHSMRVERSHGDSQRLPGCTITVGADLKRGLSSASTALWFRQTRIFRIWAGWRIFGSSEYP